MRYRQPTTGIIVHDSVRFANLPLVHVFRDDELDELARRIVDEVDQGFAIDAAVLYVLRNHASERQPGSADGAG